jgi:hypothetical protein
MNATEAKHTPGPYHPIAGVRCGPRSSDVDEVRSVVQACPPDDIEGTIIAECDRHEDARRIALVLNQFDGAIAELEETAAWLDSLAQVLTDAAHLGGSTKTGEQMRAAIRVEAAKFRARAMLIRATVTRAKGGA